MRGAFSCLIVYRDFLQIAACNTTYSATSGCFDLAIYDRTKGQLNVTTKEDLFYNISICNIRPR